MELGKKVFRVSPPSGRVLNHSQINSRTGRCYKQGCPIYGKIRYVLICITCFSLRTKKRFMDESTDFYLLGSATTLRPHCTFETRGISREPSELFSATTPPPPTHCTFETRGISRAPSQLFSTTTPPRSDRLPDISGLFGIPIGNPI